MQRTCSQCAIQFHYTASPKLALGACPHCETLMLLPGVDELSLGSVTPPSVRTYGPSLMQLESTPTTNSMLVGASAAITGMLLLAAIAHLYAGHLVTFLGMGDPAAAAPGIAVMLGTLIAWMVLHAQGNWSRGVFLLLSGGVGGWLLLLGLRKLAPVRALMALRRLRHAPASIFRASAQATTTTEALRHAT